MIMESIYSVFLSWFFCRMHTGRSWIG